jgi:uncharacterized SAM-binding protein YcdF (DUF218 family)
MVVRTAVVVPGHGAIVAGSEYRITERCRQLVRQAERLAGTSAPVAVVFTGWSPVGGPSEAEQMRELWRGPPVELVVESTARTTVENATRTVPLLLEREIERAAIVCALPHLTRAWLFFGQLYGARGIRTRFEIVRAMPTLGSVAWELAALPLAPWQLFAARARRDLRAS